MSKNDYTIEGITKTFDKKAWMQPVIAEINVNAVKQQDEELYLQMLADPEVFERLSTSGGSSAD